MGQKAAGATGTDAGTDAAVKAGSTALPYVGLGVNLLQTGMSLVNASEQAGAQREAQRQAELATKMQIQQQQQNFFEAMQVPTGAYDRALREGTAQQQQALMGLQEGDPRLLAGGVGKVQAAAGDYNAQARDEMAKQMFDLQKLQAQEKMLNADDLAKIYENRTIGAQKAAAAAELAQVGALNNAFTGISDFATRVDAARKERKPAINPNGQINSGIKTQEPSNFVDFNTGFNPTNLYRNYNTQQQGTLPGQYSSIFPSVSAPSSTWQNVNMFSSPNTTVSANSFNPSPRLDMFGNIIQ